MTEKAAPTPTPEPRDVAGPDDGYLSITEGVTGLVCDFINRSGFSLGARFSVDAFTETDEEGGMWLHIRMIPVSKSGQLMHRLASPAVLELKPS